MYLFQIITYFEDARIVLEYYILCILKKNTCALYHAKLITIDLGKNKNVVMNVIPQTLFSYRRLFAN